MAPAATQPHLSRQGSAVSSTRGPPPAPIKFVTCYVQGSAKGDVQVDELNRVISLRASSPAADAGVKIGDRIFKVDNVALTTEGLDEVLSRGEEVALEIERASSSSTPSGFMPAPPSPVPAAAGAARAAAAAAPAAAAPAAAAPRVLAPAAEEPPTTSQAMCEIEPVVMQGAKEAAASKRGHARRVSAPPGMDHLAAVARSSLGLPIATGEMPLAGRDKTAKNATPAKPDSALQKLKCWWAERQSRQQAASGKGAAKAQLPMPAFLEEAFSTDSFDSPFDDLRMTNNEDED